MSKNSYPGDAKNNFSEAFDNDHGYLHAMTKHPKSDNCTKKRFPHKFLSQNFVKLRKILTVLGKCFMFVRIVQTDHHDAAIIVC